MRIKTKMRGIKSGHVDSDSDGLEVWDGVSTEEVVRDIPAATPLPEPEKWFYQSLYCSLSFEASTNVRFRKLTFRVLALHQNE